MDLRFDCGDIYILKDNFDKLKKIFLDYLLKVSIKTFKLKNIQFLI